MKTPPNFKDQILTTSPIQHQVVRRQGVQGQFGIGNTCMHDRIKDGLLPPPIHILGRSVGWLQHEIDQVMAFMVAGKSKDDIRALVRHLVEQRKHAADQYLVDQHKQVA